MSAVAFLQCSTLNPVFYELCHSFSFASSETIFTSKAMFRTLFVFFAYLCVGNAWLSSRICKSNAMSTQSASATSTSIAATLANDPNSNEAKDLISDVAVVLLAGGKGKRMKSSMPKQFLKVLGKPVFLRSLDIFRSMPDVVSKIVIVLDKSYRDDFSYLLSQDKRIVWADPGQERQDSVFNGLSLVPDTCKLVAIHDAARPLVTVKEVLSCLKDGLKHGAAVLGVPMKATVKESLDGEFVLRTIQRSKLWEIHTPQVSTKELFLQGFAKVQKDNLEVTDDVSVIEALGLPVKLTLGEYTNIKLTTPDDLQIAEQILRERGESEVTDTEEGEHISTTCSTSSLKAPKEAYACSSERYRDSLNTRRQQQQEEASASA